MRTQLKARRRIDVPDYDSGYVEKRRLDCLFDHYLDVDRPHAFMPVVHDVVCPRPTFDVD